MLESRLSATPITTFFCANDVQHERQLSVQKNVRWAQSQIIAFFFASTGWAIGRHSCNKAVVSVWGSKKWLPKLYASLQWWKMSITVTASPQFYIGLDACRENSWHRFTIGWEVHKKWLQRLYQIYTSIWRVKMAVTALPKLCNSLEQSGPSPTQKARKMRKQRKKKVTAHHYPERKHAKYRLKQEAWKWDTRTFNSDGLS